jgi:thymidylate kinase
VDFVGKTTVSLALARLLGAVYYKSPGGKYAETRKLVDETIDPLQRYLFYRESVQYDSGEISKLLEFSSVVCDRYIFSTFAFHAALDESLQSRFECEGIIMPHHVFLLTADENVRLKRLAKRSVTAGLDKNMPVQRKADEIFRRQGHIVLDTTHTTDEETANAIFTLLRAGGRYAQKR